MKTTIIMIRHGESESNKTHVFTGQLNTPLTELGRHQAALAAKALSNVKIDKIYSSDLSRAYDTGNAVATAKNLHIIKDENLREIYAGEWENLPFDSIKELYPEDYNIWMNNIGAARCTGGESVAELYDRIVAEVIRIAKENEGKTVCLATHATPVRVVCAYASNIPSERLCEEPFPGNASISIFEYENGILTAKVKGDTSHLLGFETFLPDNI